MPVFLSYVLSFVFLGIYWNNHHHLLQAAERVDGRDPVGEPAPALLALAGPVRHRLDGREPLRRRCPSALYGVVLLLAAIAYFILARALIALHGQRLGARDGARRGLQGQASRSLLYLLADPARLRRTGGGLRVYVLVAVMWLVPDRRIERTLARAE